MHNYYGVILNTEKYTYTYFQLKTRFIEISTELFHGQQIIERLQHLLRNVNFFMNEYMEI